MTAWIIQTGYDAQGKVIAVRNPFYWKVDTAGSQLPYIDQVEFTQCKSESEVAALAASGKLDMQDRHLDLAAALPAIQAAAQRGDIRTFKTIPSSCNVAACFLNLTHTNASKRALYRQLSFRVALSCSLNRERIIREVYGGVGRPFQVGPRPESPYHHTRLGNQYTRQDLKMAEEQFRSAGLTSVGPDGWRRDARGDVVRFELCLADFHTSVVRTAGYLSEDWRAMGVDCQLRVLPMEQFVAYLKMNQHDAALMPGEGGLDFLTEPVHILPLTSLSAFGIGWTGTEVTPENAAPPEVRQQLELFAEVQSANDRTHMLKLVRQILDIAADQFYAIGVALPRDGCGVISPRLRNVPEIMPGSWTFPHPAPVNPCQFYFEPAKRGTNEFLGSPGPKGGG